MVELIRDMRPKTGLRRLHSALLATAAGALLTVTGCSTDDEDDSSTSEPSAEAVEACYALRDLVATFEQYLALEDVAPAQAAELLPVVEEQIYAVASSTNRTQELYEAGAEFQRSWDSLWIDALERGTVNRDLLVKWYVSVEVLTDRCSDSVGVAVESLLDAQLE